MRKTCLILTLIFFVFSLQAQDLNYVKTQVKKLTSPEFHGRGYVKKGDQIASDYLSRQFKNFGLLPFELNYFQNYSFEVNTFPNRMSVSINGKTMEPAIDFYVNPGSGGVKGSFPIVRFGLKDLDQDTSHLIAFFKADHTHEFVMLDTAGWGKDNFRKALGDAISGNLLKARGILEIVDTGMIFSVRTYQNDYVKLTLRRRAIPANATQIDLTIDQKLIQHNTRNIIGYLPGETDTFLVFTAHYDHLGQMGKDIYFPGANDNASGTSMILDLIRALSQKKSHHYSYAFMLFSGEEAGLLGSQYYTGHPLFPLAKIKQVLNFDMVGTGADGVDIFNGSVLKKEFALLDTINKTNKFGVNLVMKSTSRGSDHYSFHQKGVPALFILTDEKKAPYHVPEDRAGKLSFLAYEHLFKLIYQYIEAKEDGQIIYSPDTDR